MGLAIAERSEILAVCPASDGAPGSPNVYLRDLADDVHVVRKQPAPSKTHSMMHAAMLVAVPMDVDRVVESAVASVASHRPLHLAAY